MTETSTLTSVQRSRILGGLREKLQDVYRVTRARKQIEVDYKTATGEAIPDLETVAGVNDQTVRFTDSDGVEQAAKLVQNSPGNYWDLALLVEWLKQNNKWNAVKATVLDDKKLAAEIAVGNIDFEQIKHLYLQKDAPSAYIKFVNATADSL